MPGPPVKHGHSYASGRSPTYRTWHGMKQRVTNENCHASEYYSKRGIDMDPRWADFENFLMDMGERPAGKSLDRIDNDRGYWPDNCRWATQSEQLNNRRNNVFIEHSGAKKTVQQWSKETGTPFGTIRRRMQAGWATDQVLNADRPRARNQFTKSKTQL